jgi:hypothetical protein
MATNLSPSSILSFEYVCSGCSDRFFALMDKFGKFVLGARGLITHDGRGLVMQVSWGHGLLSQIPGSGIYDDQ